MNWVFISQKTTFFIVPTVKTSNLIYEDAVWGKSGGSECGGLGLRYV
jgi:hypothetical protein